MFVGENFLAKLVIFAQFSLVKSCCSASMVTVACNPVGLRDSNQSKTRVGSEEVGVWLFPICFYVVGVLLEFCWSFVGVLLGVFAVALWLC